MKDHLNCIEVKVIIMIVINFSVQRYPLFCKLVKLQVSYCQNEVLRCMLKYTFVESYKLQF